MLKKLKLFKSDSGPIQRINQWFGQFRDVRAIGLVVFLAVALTVSWSGAKVIQQNYELQKQISQLRQENAVQELANTNIKLENQYFTTDQYLELKARQDFGLGAAGETQLIIPKEVAMAYITPSAAADKVIKSVDPASQRPTYQRNFEEWVDFFLHRQGEL